MPPVQPGSSTGRSNTNAASPNFNVHEYEDSMSAAWPAPVKPEDDRSPPLVSSSSYWMQDPPSFGFSASSNNNTLGLTDTHGPLQGVPTSEGLAFDELIAENECGSVHPADLSSKADHLRTNQARQAIISYRPSTYRLYQPIHQPTTRFRTAALISNQPTCNSIHPTCTLSLQPSTTLKANSIEK